MKNLYFTLILLVCGFMFCGCGGGEIPEPPSTQDPYPSELDSRYIVFFLANTSVDQADSENSGKDADTRYTFVGELPQIFGDIDAEDKYKYAFGIPGPMLLTQSVEQMQYQVNKAFDIAEKYNVPVYFQLDDCTNYTWEFGDGASPKYYDDPLWCEWVDFPQEGEAWGGESNGRPPYFWFNWGAWMHRDPFPSFQSPGFREWIAAQLSRGVLEPLCSRYEKLCREGKEYLLAGITVGWETNIPDYSTGNPFSGIDHNNLPVNVLEGDRMQPWEATRLGYNSLHQLGYTEYSYDALCGVIHDYSEFLAKTIHDAGIPKYKIFTHIVGLMSYWRDARTTAVPPIWTAVNDYCVPGFTLSPETCIYNLDNLKHDILQADPSQKYFANTEGYSRGVDGTVLEADKYFDSMFGRGAVLVTVFGWGREVADSPYAVSHSPNSPFVQAAKKWLDYE